MLNLKTKTMRHYNTTNLKGEHLKEATAKTESQSKRIMKFFSEHPKSMFTPFEVCKYVFNDSCPVTSCRRSLTDLTNEGLLRKTNTQKIGNYGAFNYTWRLS